MLKNDYMKEVENTLRLLTEEVDKNIINGQIEEAKERVNKVLKAVVGIDIGTVDIFSFNSLDGLISKEMQYNAEKFIVFACLMNLQGKISSKENNENLKIQYYEKSLEGFYKAYNEDDETNSKYLDDAVEVAGELVNYELSLDLDKKIFKIYELANKFDKAEDTLFYMLRKTNDDGSMILEGMRFYDRLKERELDELILGNLPIEEIEDGISELERRLEM
ncbi:hypothetical protein psyc5s11_23630 [Clostridium gelidum]|uniref:Tetratricopeptide repeat protein n=1 Tax=Clostridium gelidum TaxID=704125 RepID=A0ABM7T4Z2_9CLOT|nr:DUF6483 family protein [Clostridium gelidum]BCZ46296.1 hypothetical protein psyc5s11_23630 [Clostridium gelidum]